MTNEFLARLEGYVRLIDGALASYLPPTDTPQGAVAEAMAYSALGGKRIRGVLLLAAYEAGSGDGDVTRALPFACALEFIHAYSLIHDDLPCMDDDDVRRGKPSCHVAFGEDIALLAGDALQTLAFELCTGPEAAAFGADRALAAAHALARAAGTGGMAGGQVIDLQSENKAVGADTLRLMDRMKTGALIAAAAEMGCILGGAGAGMRLRLTAYAMELGLAFQVVDDILDVTGSGEALGKPVGSDREKGKSTYVGLLGLDGARALAEELSQRALSELAATGLNTGFLAELADYLLYRDH